MKQELKLKPKQQLLETETAKVETKSETGNSVDILRIMTSSGRQKYPHRNAHYYRCPHILWWVSISSGMTIIFLQSFSLVDAEKSPAFYSFLLRSSLFLFRSVTGIRIVFALACATHVVEAMIALYVMSGRGYTHTWWLWGIQTLLLGYPSLRLLLARNAFLERTKREREGDGE